MIRKHILALGVALVLCIGQAFAQTSAVVDPELVRLRHEWATNFFEPASHMKLAKYFREKGNLLQAFYILETARRGRFEPKVFDDAFLLHFGGFAPLDNSPAEEAKYIDLLKASPNDVKLLNHLADIYISREEYSRGEPFLRSAYEKEPKNYRTLLALEELYSRMGRPEAGTKLVKDFEARYSDSVGGYFYRLSKLQVDSDEAKKLLVDAIAKYPDEGYFWFYKGLIAMRTKNLDEAEVSFVKATVLDKNSLRYQAAAASFFRVERKDLKRALGYYLNLYFLDPHAHFDGFAEAKVSSVNADIAKAAVDKAIAEGKAPESLFDDANPAVVGMALSKTLDGTRTEDLLKLMRHDDVTVRWIAMQMLTGFEGRKLDATVKELLKDPDLRVRGLAAYMAVKLWKNESFPEMKKLLNEKAQVLRFDAVSALLMLGGPEGKRIVIEHKAKEPSEYLKKMIESSLSEKDPS